jgi:NAD(P)-dependent dehydrogenase (short-subunit alcohol dehydrogenase family)
VRGVGAGISAVFAAQGATVVTCARRPVDGLPYDFPCDVRDDASVAAMIGAIVEKHGRLDVVVNNAGGSPYVTAAEASAKFSSKIIELTCLARCRFRSTPTPSCRPRTRADRSSTSPVSAAAAHAGYRGLRRGQGRARQPDRHARGGMGAQGPGLRRGGHGRDRAVELFYGDAESVAAVAATVPLQRLAKPADIGWAAAFLASGAASYISGATLEVHGGGEPPTYLEASSANKPRRVMGLLDGRVVIVTGAGGGIGRAHALAFAAEGRASWSTTSVSAWTVTRRRERRAGVVDEITAAGEAVANGSNVADWAQAEALIQTAVENFGGLDVLVNNAGIVRDRMFVNATEDEFDAVTAVHSRGTSPPCGTPAPTGAPGPRPAKPWTPASSTPAPAPGCRAASGRPPTAPPRPASRR